MTMRFTQTLLLAFFSLFSLNVFAQTRGVIYKPASSILGRKVLDPNGDGFVSATSAGFTGTEDYGAQSELKMIPLPVMGAEPTDDVSTGGSGGHTEIVSNTAPNQYSCFVLYKKVEGEYYLIFRFRIGNASTASKGYSVLFDTDGIFGNQHSDDNPGFDKEVVMQTGNGGGVVIYNHSGATATEVTRFDLDAYSQRSVAVTNVNNNTDYFYDFFVPYPALDLTFDPVRISAVTITSASSGLVGTKADFNGINDKLYGNDPIAISKALVGAFPAVPITSMVEGFTFPQLQSSAPTVNAPIRVGATSISGTSTEDNGATIQVFDNGNLIGTTTVSNNTWTLSSVTGLVLGDLVTARVTGTNKSQSPVSNTVTVENAAPCYTNRPVITNMQSGQLIVTVNWTNPSGANITNGSVLIKLYNLSSGSLVEYTQYTTRPAYIPGGASSGSVDLDLKRAGFNTTDFNALRLFATATVNGCESRLSDPFNYTAPDPPVITTSPILASPTVQRSVTVQNPSTNGVATIILYLGSTQIGSASSVGIGASTTFNYTGFAAGDSVSARAVVNNVFSNRSDVVVVAKSNIQAAAPIITGTYNSIATSVSGTSTESAGTTIYLYANGIQIGTGTVNAGGAWTVSGLTLVAGQTLTARAENAEKYLSAVSNSVTINANVLPPTVTGPSIVSGSTSISGTGGQGTVTVYIDGSPIGTTTGANWTLSPISSNQLYRGASVTATNTVSGVEGGFSTAVPVVGVASFDITDVNGNALTTVQAGTPFNVRIRSLDGSSALFTGFTGSVNLSSTNSAFGTGSGNTASFTAGVLNPHSMSLTTAGSSRNISVVNVNDPSATGSTTITVTAGPASKLTLNAPANITPTRTRATYTVSHTDTYGNLVNVSGSPLTVSLASSNSPAGRFYDASLVNSGNLITTVTIPVGSSSATFYFDVTQSGNFVVTVSASGLISATDDILAGFVWTGANSTTWSLGTNWVGNTAPIDYDDVIIPAGSTRWPILDVNPIVGDLFIGDDGSVTLNGRSMTIDGALTGTGKFIGSSASSLIITGSGALGTLYFDQTTNGTTNRLGTLTLNRNPSGTAILGNNVHVTTLSLQRGIIDIGDATMTVTGLDATTAHQGSSTSYVKTSGIGFVKKSIANGGGSFRFPVGNSAFNPVTITNSTNVASEEFGVHVIDEVYDNGNGRGNQTLVTRRRVTRTWEITKASSGNATGLGVGFAFQWNQNETAGSGLDVTNLSMFHHNRTTWGAQTGTHTRDGNNRILTFTGYNGSFSPFSLQDPTGTLPVVWGGFTAKAEGASVKLNWSTVTEIDSKDFVVQHSTDGIRWSEIGVIASSGNSRLRNDYAFLHTTPEAGNNYYRLMERSFNGAVQFSSIVSVNLPLSGKLVIYGNPVTNGMLKFSLPKTANVTLNDAQGRILFRGKMEAGLRQIDLQGKPSGLYYLRAGSSQRTILVQ